ncbi:MAG: hypothetical protein JW809_13545 [Pirellulales bacterium]|nr:hypothetical protein [Pirellulales bacterium]
MNHRRRRKTKRPSRRLAGGLLILAAATIFPGCAGAGIFRASDEASAESANDNFPTAAQAGILSSATHGAPANGK